MKRLRHPIRAIREPFGTAGLIVAMVALVAALGGTALAASKLNSTQKKEVEKIAKKYAGKAGASGVTGPVGPAGAAGKDGAPGTNGTNGTNGSPGAAGKSVKLKAVVPGAEGDLQECEERGGAEVGVEGASTAQLEICNGEEGPEGRPWSPNSVLPAGAQETGVWFFQADSGPAYAPISFPIPLGRPSPLKWVSPASSENTVHYEGESNFGDFDEGGGGKLGCTGNSQVPLAPPGHLCVYQSELNEEATFDEPVSLNTEANTLPIFGGLLKFTVLHLGTLGSGGYAVKAACGSSEQIVEQPSVPAGFTEFICKKSA